MAKLIESVYRFLSDIPVMLVFSIYRLFSNLATVLQELLIILLHNYHNPSITDSRSKLVVNIVGT